MKSNIDKIRLYFTVTTSRITTGLRRNETFSDLQKRSPFLERKKDFV